MAVLDWGLGHASRCVPLIRALVADGHRLLVGSAGDALALLEAECPQVPKYTLPSYGVRYPFKSMFWSMSWQGPKVLRTAWRENRLTKQIVETQNIDLIISDGRFGCFYPGMTNIWLAHQLQIQLDRPAMAQPLNGAYHAHLRRHFQEVWVPDWPGEDSLAGRLSAPVPGLSHRYLGALTRYQPRAEIAEEDYRWIALLSGPEPLRGKLEAELTEALASQTEPCLLVRGVSGNTDIRSGDGPLSTVDWLHGAALANAVARGRYLLCRSGYSTLLDLVAWRKPALLIPTPGQTEQEYLARYWQEKGWAITQSHDRIDLNQGEQALAAAPRRLTYPKPEPLVLPLGALTE